MAVMMRDAIMESFPEIVLESVADYLMLPESDSRDLADG